VKSPTRFRRYYEKADRSSAVTGEELLRLLERRLDNILYRAGFALTRAQARQIASHGLVNLNGRRITVPSIQLRVGDKIEVRKKNADSPLFQEVKSGKDKIKPPTWLSSNPKSLTIEVLALPEEDELEKIISQFVEKR